VKDACKLHTNKEVAGEYAQCRLAFRLAVDPNSDLKKRGNMRSKKCKRNTRIIIIHETKNI